MRQKICITRFPVLVVFISFVALFLTGCSSNKKTIINEYGLEIVGRLKDYKNSVDTFPARKLVLLSSYLKPFASNIYYANPNNFTGQTLYRHHQLYLNIEAAEKTFESSALTRRATIFLIFDTYRPYAVTKKIWEIVPGDRYAANPAHGSGHNRGIAIDLSLINIETGKPIEMPCGYDNFSDTAHHDFMQLPSTVIENRQLL